MEYSLFLGIPTVWDESLYNRETQGIMDIYIYMYTEYERNMIGLQQCYQRSVEQTRKSGPWRHRVSRKLHRYENSALVSQHSKPKNVFWYENILKLRPLFLGGKYT